MKKAEELMKMEDFDGALRYLEQIDQHLLSEKTEKLEEVISLGIINTTTLGFQLNLKKEKR